MSNKCLLFVYGLLKPGIQPPRSVSQQWSDKISGLMYDLGGFPAAIGVEGDEGVIHGFTVEIESDELAALDEFEDLDSGMYRRVMIETKLGYFAWVYEYLKPIPDGLTPISDWQK